MARIPTYAIDTVFDSNDLLLGTDGSTTALITKNFRVGGLTDHIIDQLIEPNATDFHIPVFHTGGTRITDSIISQNIYPNGTTISVSGGLSVSGGASIGLALNVGGVIVCADRITGQDSISVLGSLANGSGKLIIGDNEGINSVKITIPSYSDGSAQYGNLPATSSYSLVFPPNAGNFNQQLTTDGTGVLSWKDDIILDCPNSIYIGSGAGESDPCNASADPSQGSIGPLFNIGIGTDAIKSQVYGSNPVSGLESAGENIGVGIAALKLTTTGTNNIAIGADSLASNVTGYNNVAISKNALGGVVNGSQNIASNNTSIGIGFSAGNPNVNQPNQVPHIGDTIIGHQAGADQIYSSSSKNVYLGFRAGRNSGIFANPNFGLMSAADNVVIGNSAGLGVGTAYGATISDFTFRRNIFIGKNAGAYTSNVGIEDNIVLGSRGTDPLYLKAGNVVFHTGGFGNNMGITSTATIDGGVSNNFVLGSNISVYGSQNIILNPNRSTDSSTGISVGESDFRPTTGIWDDDFSKNVIIGGGETPGIKISASGVGQNTTQNTQNTIINSGSVWSPSDVQYTGIQLESNSIYDVKNNTILGSNDIYLKTNMGTTTNGNQIRGNTFINSDGILIEGKFEGNTIINYKGSNFTPNVNFNVGTPASPTSSAGTSNNFIIGKYGSTSTDYQVYVGASNNILGPLGQGVEVMGDGNLLFGVSNIKLFNDSNANLAFGQNITAGTDTPGGEAGNRRAQRSLLFGFNIDVANNQSLQNSLVGGSNTTFDSGNTTQIQNAIAVGSGLIGAGSNSAHFGKNNEATTSSLLTIGCGAGTSNRANALEVRDDASSIPGRAVVYLHQTELQNYATQADATAAGLSNGAIYHTDGTLKIVY